MPAVYLGKVHLHWCFNCNIPLVEKSNCGICSEEGEPVKITPPGDVRPAFEHDLDLIRNTIDRQWGEGYWKNIIPENKLVLLNSCPAEDRMDEVIVDGKVRGIIRYVVEDRIKNKEPYSFILRPHGEMPRPTKGYAVVDKGAVDPIKNGASALAPGIIDADQKIAEGDEVIITSPEGNVIGAGRSHLSGEELVNRSKGKGVKVRWRSKNKPEMLSPCDWKKAIRGNRHIVDDLVSESVEFIEETVKEHQVPMAVSYSGGKDSLATLLLVLDADLKPDMIFIDTGIELPETIKNVKQTAERYGLNVITKDAKTGYWDNVDYFGPSARDYRWCCKTCKLGPTALLIKERYPDGLLSFIGQRRYESENRMFHGDTWTNPWVPDQIGASPIQNWTALHVWLYLFMKDADYNPWYEKGFERIGCWVCPASDLAELEILEEKLDDFHIFKEKLIEYKEELELPDEWIEFGLWRWLDIPDEVEKLVDDSIENPEKDEEINYEYIMTNRVKEMMNIFKDEPKERTIQNIYRRIEHCTSCGVCVAACPKNALYLEDGIRLHEERCIQCQKCLQKCPIIEFDSRVR